MQLYRLKPSYFLKFTFVCLSLLVLCVSCNEKPRFKKKHYTTKRVTRNYKRSDSMIATSDKKNNANKDIVVTKPKTKIKQKPEIIKTPTSPRNTINVIEKKQNKYYVISASYSLKEKAMILALEYKRLGFPVEIISANKKYRVTLNSNADKQKAIKLRDSLRLKLQRKDLWLLRY